MIAPLIKPGNIRLGVETLRCPRCRLPNRVAIDSDLPAEDYLICARCGYKGLLYLRPILRKYGLPEGLSREEKRDFSHHLQRDINKI